MEATRVDTKKLKEAVDNAVLALMQVEELLAPHLVILTDKDRQSLLRPREGFGPAARTMARAMASFPAIATVSGCEPDALVEDIENAEVIAPLAERTRELSQRLADSRLTWLSEAWSPALTAYGVAKVLARTDGKVRELVDPLASVFASARTRKPVEPK